MKKLGIIIILILNILTFAKEEDEYTKTLKNYIADIDNNTSSSKVNKHFFYRIGIGNMDVGSRYSALDFNLGLHYYLYGFDKDSIGLGISYNSSRKYKEDGDYYCFDDTNCKEVDTFEKANIKYFELLYNFNLWQNFYLTCTLIKGKLTTKTEIDDDGYKETLYDKTLDIGGFGFYFILPDIKKENALLVYM